MTTEPVLTDPMRKLLREAFNEDGSQRVLIRCYDHNMWGDSRTSREWNNARKLVEAGVLKDDVPYKWKKKRYDRKANATVIEDVESSGFAVVEEFRYLITEPIPVSLSKSMVTVLDWIEENGGGPFTAKEMSSYYDRKAKKSVKNTGLGAPSVKSNCEKLTEAGLLAQSKKGRSFVWTRTDLPRAETAEARKERLEEERLEALRKKGLAHICQGCLRVVLINDTGSFGSKDQVCRHGWNLISWNGGREGNHTEGCIGWNHLPLERGYDVAVRVMKRLTAESKYPIQHAKHLSKRPTLTLRRSEWEGWSKKKIEEDPKGAAEEVKVKPGDVLKRKEKWGDREYTVSTYEDKLRERLWGVRTNLRNLISDSKLFARRVGDFWANEEKSVPEVVETIDAMLGKAIESAEALGLVNKALQKLAAEKK